MVKNFWVPLLLSSDPNCLITELWPTLSIVATAFFGLQEIYLYTLHIYQSLHFQAKFKSLTESTATCYFPYVQQCILVRWDLLHEQLGLAVSPKSPEHPHSLHTGMQQHTGPRHIQEGGWAGGVCSQSQKNEEDWLCWQTPIYISTNSKEWFWGVVSRN